MVVGTSCAGGSSATIGNSADHYEGRGWGGFHPCHGYHCRIRAPALREGDDSPSGPPPSTDPSVLLPKDCRSRGSPPIRPERVRDGALRVEPSRPGLHRLQASRWLVPTASYAEMLAGAQDWRDHPAALTEEDWKSAEGPLGACWGIGAVEAATKPSSKLQEPCLRAIFSRGR
jgi:hypothetical protein